MRFGLMAAYSLRICLDSTIGVLLSGARPRTSHDGDLGDEIPQYPGSFIKCTLNLVVLVSIRNAVWDSRFGWTACLNSLSKIQPSNSEMHLKTVFRQNNTRPYLGKKYNAA